MSNPFGTSFFVKDIPDVLSISFNFLISRPWIITIDTPFFPESIIENFIQESKKKESLILCASSHGRKHNIFGLWSLDLYDKLKNDLINKKIRKVQDWTEKNKIKNLEFKFKDYDPFFNINTNEDLEFAKKFSTRIKNEQK